MLPIRIPVATFTLVLTMAACTDDPVSVIEPPSNISGSISDTKQTGENTLLQWVTPITDVNESSLGALRSGLSTATQLCQFAEGQDRTDSSFCSTPDGSEVQWSATAQAVDNHYETTLNLNEVTEEMRYRLTALVDGYKMGHVDFEVKHDKELINLDLGNDIEITEDKTLSVRYHVPSAAALDGFCATDLTECFRGTVTPEGGTFTVPSRHAGVFFPDGALLEPVTLYIERIPVSDDASDCLPTAFDQYEGCYRYTTDPELERFELDVTVGQCIEPDGKDNDNLQLYKFDDEGQFTSPLTALENASVGFLDCANFKATATQTTAASSTLMQRMLAAGSHALSPLARLLSPTLLHATDTGLGGLTDSFSRIGWVDAWYFDTYIRHDKQTADPEALLKPVTVYVLASHETMMLKDAEEPAPLADVEVLAKLTSPGGEMVHSEVLVSDQNGRATYRPLLSAGFGTYTLSFESAQTGPSPTTSATALASQNDGRGSLLVKVTSGGSPIEGALLELSNEDPLAGLPHTLTNAEGYGGLNHVPGNASYTLDVQVNGESVASATVTVTADQTDEYSIDVLQ